MATNLDKMDVFGVPFVPMGEDELVVLSSRQSMHLPARYIS